jgi:glycosyltransferase involved in cell wall biosynthesis
LKVLHITNWYPTRENPYEAIWIKRHLDSLSNYVDQEVWHVEVKGGKKLKYQKYTDESGCYHRILEIPFNRWFIIELFTTFLLWWLFRFQIKRSEFNILNFHIAYPLLTYWNWLKGLVKIPVVITEHWSAYHMNFGMPKETTKLERIKRIFHKKLPVFTVSKALGDDIANFAKAPNLERHVIPNLVLTEIFNNKNPKMPDTPTFFMISNWAYPKIPDIAIKAFASILKDYPIGQLRIGGYGKLILEMEVLVKDLGIEKQVVFLGKLSAEEIAKEQNKASAYLHASSYETFSVVCVEALCCGTPVIASNVGGIPEYISAQNGILVDVQDVESWTNALRHFMQKNYDFNRSEIAAEAAARFDYNSVGKLYYETLNGQLNISEKQII